MHNPGDFREIRGQKFPGQVSVDKRGYVKFKNDAAGWAALEHQIEKMIDGSSGKFTQNMPIWQIAKIYASDYRTWAKNVAKQLKVTPSTTPEEYFDLPPRVVYKRNRELWNVLNVGTTTVIPVLSAESAGPANISMSAGVTVPGGVDAQIFVGEK